MKRPWLGLTLFVGVIAGGCTDELSTERMEDSGVDAGVGADADVELDAGEDAAIDSGDDMRDAGVDAEVDASFDAGERPFVFTPIEAKLLSKLSPLPDVPANPTNAVADNELAAALGQAFFFDKRFSGPIRVAGGTDLGAMGDTDRISCASCHNGNGMDDQRTPPPRRVSLGADFHARNAPSVINSVFYTWTNWGGRFSAPWELPIAVVEAGVIMNGNRLEVAHIIYDNYRTQYEAIFGPMDSTIATLPTTGKPNAAAPGNWEMLLTGAERTMVDRVLINFGKVIEAYERKLVSRNAPFDQLVAGDADAISNEAKKGARLFLGKARCINCHNGPLLSDNLFHNLSVPQTGVDHVPAMDNGRFNDIPGLINSPFSTNTSASDDTTTGRVAGLTNPAPASTRGQFRTPTLRGVTRTAPYMHSGQLDTLEQVIDFYDVAGEGFGAGASGTPDPLLLPLGLTDDEKAALLAFLMTLDGESVASGLLVDPATTK